MKDSFSLQKMPLVSIVFTSFNHLEYLELALNSLLDQSYTNFELIIVDDCSSDGSREYLKQRNFDNRVSLNLLDKNTGSYVHASNFGASLAKGDFILFAQCDDFSENNQLYDLVKYIQDDPSIGVVYSSSNLVDSKGYFLSNDFFHREKSFRVSNKYDNIIRGDDMFEFLTRSCVIPNLSSALIRRSLFISVGGLSSKYKIVADWEFWMKMSLVTNFFYVRKPLNNFRQHSTTIRSSYKSELQFDEIFQVFRDFNFSLDKNKKYLLGYGFAILFFRYYYLSPSFMSFFRMGKKVFNFNQYSFNCLGKALFFVIKEKL